MTDVKEPEYEYQDDLHINRHKLADELIKQPAMFMKYAELSATARFEMDKAKERLDLCRAELDNKIRESPTKYGFSADKKPTEAAITSAIIMDDTYITSNKEYLEACLNYNILTSAKDAFSHKKSSLENLVKLFLSEYWADVKEPEAVEVTGKRTVEKLTDDLQNSARPVGRRRLLSDD